jgi:hypothetical protein
MDTTTVLQIIKMIDHRLDAEVNNIVNSQKKSDKHYFIGKAEGYEELRDHLQSFIEGQLSAAENQTGE